MRSLLLTILFVIFIGTDVMALNIKSTAFEDKSSIPARCVYDSTNASPSLVWSNVPENTQSLVLICDDPDAPFKPWVHWVIFNIPKEKTELEENVPKEGMLPDGTVQGKNDFGKIGYDGPCPPPGKPHRYFFKLYALDTKLSLSEGAAKNDVLNAMKGHVIDEAELMSTYQR